MNYFFNDINFLMTLTKKGHCQGNLMSTWAFFLYHPLLQRAGSLIISVVKKKTNKQQKKIILQHSNIETGNNLTRTNYLALQSFCGQEYQMQKYSPVKNSLGRAPVSTPASPTFKVLIGELSFCRFQCDIPLSKRFILDTQILNSLEVST